MSFWGCYCMLRMMNEEVICLFCIEHDKILLDCHSMNITHNKMSLIDISWNWLEDVLRCNWVQYLGFFLFCLWLNNLCGWTTGLPPLAAFGWVMGTHLSLYPGVLIIPVWVFIFWWTCHLTRNMRRAVVNLLFAYVPQSISVVIIVNFVPVNSFTRKWSRCSS